MTLLEKVSSKFLPYPHPQCVDVVATRESASVRGRSSANVRSASSGMDAAERHEVLRDRIVGTYESLDNVARVPLHQYQLDSSGTEG
jgi:hypothetical protein